MKKDGLEEKARNLYKDLQADYMAEFDVAGSIGKRYRRQDEIGTPYCVTIDYETKEDDTVTIRDRDQMTQERVAFDQVTNYLKDKLKF
jgi:glycyl-tRNA synthetase